MGTPPPLRRNALGGEGGYPLPPSEFWKRVGGHPVRVLQRRSEELIYLGSSYFDAEGG